MTEAIEKINLNDITSTYEVKNTEAFTQYLKQVWKDLNSRSGDESSKGIDKVTFKQYYNLPGIISERLFSVFDSENTGYLSLQNFTEKMLILFSSDLDKLLQFILDFYDFDKDGKITKEDVRIVLSYVPIYKKRKNKKNEGLKFDTDDFNDRIVLQKELHEKLDNIFEKKESIDLNEFTDVIKNKNSDIFLFILVFLYEHRPFSFETVKNLENIKKSPELSTKKDIFIASHNLDSNFIVSQTLQKSPAMKNKGLNDKNKNIYKNMKYLGLLSGRNLNLEQENNNVNNNLNNNNINKTENKVVFSLKIPTGNNNNNENIINDNNINNINEKNDLINLEEKEQKKPKRKHLKNISDKTDISEENKKYDDENEEEEIMNFSYARPFEGRDIPKNSEKNN